MRKNENIKIKSGMGGSRCGKNRYDTTETLKRVSKKIRRQGKAEAQDSNN